MAQQPAQPVGFLRSLFIAIGLANPLAPTATNAANSNSPTPATSRPRVGGGSETVVRIPGKAIVAPFVQRLLIDNLLAFAAARKPWAPVAAESALAQPSHCTR